jgi:hypothetical protein
MVFNGVQVNIFYLWMQLAVIEIASLAYYRITRALLQPVFRQRLAMF